MAAKLTPKQIRTLAGQAQREGYVHRTLVGLDQFASVLTGGLPDETISSRAQRAADAGKWWGKAMTGFLHIFQRQHGLQAEAGDVGRDVTAEQADLSDLKGK
ncbi:MAG: hypothetical protein ACRD04_06045 [Terriglobales bacterium]